jgi:hypothetical protein
MKSRKRFVLVATIATGLTAASISAEAQTIFRPAPRASNYPGSPPGRYFLFSPSSAPYNRAHDMTTNAPDHTTQGTRRLLEVDPGLGLFGARLASEW